MNDETEYHLTDLLKYSYAEKPLDFAQAFNSLIGDKLETAINNKKLEIAQGIFNNSAEYEQDYNDEAETQDEYETDYETEAPEVEENGEIA